MNPLLKELALDIYGVRLSIRGPGALIEETARDFDFFAATESGTGIGITVCACPPESPQGARFSFGCGNWRVYRRPDGRRLVTYPQGASCFCDYSAGRFELKTLNSDLARELSYLLILSRAGEALDLLGLHRLHAGAVALGGIPLLFCGRQGAGKTTLLLELLKQPGFSLISDDTPLIGRDGTVYPFPLRLGIGAENPHFASGLGLRPFRRRHYPEKFLLEKWLPAPGRVKPARGGYLFKLEKAAGPGFRELGKTAAWAELAKSLALGWGVPQMGEYFIRFSPEQFFIKSGILLSRLKAARALINSSQLWKFGTGPDPAANAAALRYLLDRRSVSAAPF